MSWSQRYPQLNSADLHHRLSRIIAFGKVAETDYDKARVKVTIGEWTTTWLPWVTARASNNVNWHAPEVDEQVLVLSPSGDMAQGVVIGAVYQGEQQQQLMNDIEVENRPHVHRTKYQDGTVIEYDRQNNILKADVRGDVQLLVERNLDATVQGNATALVEGDLSGTINGEVQLQAGKSVTATVSENVNLTVSGNLNAQVDGNLDAQVGGNCNIGAANITLDASGSLTLKAGGSLSLTAPSISASKG